MYSLHSTPVNTKPAPANFFEQDSTTFKNFFEARFNNNTYLKTDSTTFKNFFEVLDSTTFEDFFEASLKHVI